MSAALSVESLAIKTLAFLTGDGDNRYGWDQRDDSWVIPMFQKVIDDGYDLWVVKYEPTREVKLRRISEALPSRKVVIKSEHARQLFEQGRIGMVARPVTGTDDEYTIERRARSARDAAENDVIATRQPAGG